MTPASNRTERLQGPNRYRSAPRALSSCSISKERRTGTVAAGTFILPRGPTPGEGAAPLKTIPFALVEGSRHPRIGFALYCSPCSARSITAFYAAEKARARPTRRRIFAVASGLEVVRSGLMLPYLALI